VRLIPSEYLARFDSIYHHRRVRGQLLTGQTVLQHGSNYEEFPPQTFPQLLDHDHPHSSPTFGQRYWVNTRHFKPGGPVIVIDGGETSGEDRLPFLDTGIAEILAKATKGVGVVLEHRYYGESTIPHSHFKLMNCHIGESVPVLNFTTDSLRWLNNSQSLADSARFMKHVKFSPSLFPSSVTQTDIDNLRAPHSPWIYYGGSYAGARAAHMRVLYPDIVFGAISSSGVTHATINNWEYMDIIRTAASSKCSEAIQSSMAHVDVLIAHPPSKLAVKTLFGLQGISHDEDFVSTITWPLSAFQGKNWDPEVGSTGFEDFCAALTGDSDGGDMIEEWNEMLPEIPVDLTLLRFARHIRQTVVPLCPDVSKQDDVSSLFREHSIIFSRIISVSALMTTVNSKELTSLIFGDFGPSRCAQNGGTS
jgi:hypothetical protein